MAPKKSRTANFKSPDSEPVSMHLHNAVSELLPDIIFGGGIKYSSVEWATGINVALLELFSKLLQKGLACLIHP